ncbi:MAG: phenylalanine--tRNA ligase subunit beta [Candidatus Bathyarchaeota archaeon]|nr:MAG: phenylalanine--tRNA ligase subunit beta [Candidatus Bathyarchaeota archaeon]
MPVIDVNLADFRELLGRDVTVEELSDRLPMMGTSWEGETEEGFHIEVFPNRPDLLSIEGLARAYASFTGAKTGFREYDVKDSGVTAFIDKKVEKVRPFFVTAIVKNIDFDDALIRSIIQMQEKLHVTHGRRRRKVAIGLHNLKPIEFPITYTTKPPEFKFRPLGERFEKDLTQILTEMHTGREYAWIVEGFEEYPMILGKKGMVLSMPPIINGEYTRIDESTRDIFIDITGTDLKAITEVLNIITTTFADRGAQIYSVRNEYHDGETIVTPDLTAREMTLEHDYVVKTLGLDLTPEESAKYLEMMGHGAIAGETLKVKVPRYRTDVMHPMDLVEDVAIAYGYDNVVPVIPDIASEAGEEPLEIFSRGLRYFMVGFGLQEVLTFMMSNREKLFTRMGLPEEPIAETSNPKMEGYTSLRNRLIPSLMEILSNNKHHPYPQNIYELDDVVLIDPSTVTGARSTRRLAVLLCHARANFSEIKAIMKSVLENLELTAEIEEGGLDCFIEGRCFTATQDGTPLGWAGEIKPEVLLSWGLEMPVTAMEMDVHELFERTKSV